MNHLKGLKAAYLTLGCKLNFAETASLRDRLEGLGIQTAEEGESADICVVNTCSVTEVADHKCRQAIHRLTRRNPNAFVVVTGCYAQLKADEIARLEGVDLVVGAEQKGRIAELLAQRLADRREESQACHEKEWGPLGEIKTFAPSCSCGERTRFFLKVQDGCDYFCSYCTIPFARGRSRNGSIASMVEQARDVAARGGREIVLTGVNTGDFGRSTGETFLELIRALDEVEGIVRYRISSIEPNLLTDEIIRFCAESRAFMPHFHVPLQSGSDEVLKLMRRRYDTALFAHKMEQIKRWMPDAFIGVDVIVGMRGETDDMFNRAFDFISGLDVSQLHVFPYSERPGTRALQIPGPVAPEAKRERGARLLELSEQKRREHYARFIGTERPVLWEHAREGQPMAGFTDNYVRVRCPEGAMPEDGSISRVRLGGFCDEGACLESFDPRH